MTRVVPTAEQIADAWDKPLEFVTEQFKDMVADGELALLNTMASPPIAFPTKA